MNYSHFLPFSVPSFVLCPTVYVFLSLHLSLSLSSFHLNKFYFAQGAYNAGTAQIKFFFKYAILPTTFVTGFI